MTPVTITHWLRQPHAALDADAVRKMIRQYPYFPVARYMAAGMQHRDEAYGSAMMNDMHLYRGSWLPFCRMMDAVTKSTAVELPVSKEQQPGAVTEANPESSRSMKDSIAESIEHAQTASDAGPQPLIQPHFTEDYFRHEGIAVSNNLKEKTPKNEDPKSLMVMMSFAEWLLHYKNTSKRQQEEETEKRALKTMWQREKLAAALEEEAEEIPQGVFDMAVNSIAREDGLASESLAEILMKQEKWEKAIEMYRKLGLRNPQKSAYFAQQISTIEKNLHS